MKTEWLAASIAFALAGAYLLIVEMNLSGRRYSLPVSFSWRHCCSR